MVIPTAGEPHDCMKRADAFVRPRPNMHTEPIVASLNLFVDGSCFRDTTGNHAGYGIAQLDEKRNISHRYR